VEHEKKLRIGFGFGERCVRRIRFGCSKSSFKVCNDLLSNHPNVRRYDLHAGRITVDAREKD